ncbi:co-chaperone GroES [Sulfurovum sp.]|jgi:chaperonin GroES|uniref:co-chaperone GroES n=1 Tax=Sulfurovum sp. TaxID=1969726 RepID=UPI002A371AC4|nr:co-chaperone GroES [Sulfurovum sp.]MDD2451363.1 co-chaperone GroES [Sulfurovum sp.]MDD3499900.1 co-chaperone GroES [Sulfurovum sp.]MDY0403030.1 co-chaperone GroES [Sulfurovum sp.]
MNFKPLGDRLLVERIEEASTTSSGIIIPDNAKDKPSQGKVIAVGSEVEEVKVGDTIVFGKYAGSEITIDNTVYLIMEQSDALGILS